MATPSPYIALALQTTCFAINDADDAAASRPRMLAAIARIGQQIGGSKRFVGQDVRLVVLPEYFLTGFPMGETASDWASKAALEIGGPEYQALGKVAQEADVFLSGNAYEVDPHFPGLYFQTSFLIAPNGGVVLRYRRLVSLFAPSPYDVWDKYIGHYGIEGVFPVADTELGKLAAIASEEILYPDIARALALRGAELFLHSSSEIASVLSTPKNVAKQARAIENLAYVVSANSAGIEGISIPKASTDGSSKVIDYKGLILAEAGYGESMAAYAEIDIAAVRRYRRRPGMGNILSRQPLGLWRDALEGLDIQPRNSLIDGGGQVTTPGRPFYTDRQKRVIDTLADAGLI